MNMLEVMIETNNRGNIEFLNWVEILEPNLHLIVRFERNGYLPSLEIFVVMNEVNLLEY